MLITDRETPVASLFIIAAVKHIHKEQLRSEARNGYIIGTYALSSNTH
jgi:hypothetical protein